VINLAAALPEVQLGNTLISLQGVAKDFPILKSGGSRLRTLWDLLSGHAVRDCYKALEGIDLTVKRGESWGFIGENGAGKSTLLKIVAGVIKPTRGLLQVNARITALLELGTGFHPEYTGRENVFLAAALLGWSRADARQHLDAILDFAGIGEHINQPVKTYSSGMVVRLGFAIATALHPDVLVTDEVLAVGDESFQRKCIRWMEDFRARGGTLLLCSHSMYHIQSLCQKTIWIHDGKVRMQGETYPVTQAYLAYHEEKNRKYEGDTRAAVNSVSYPFVEDLYIQNATGAVCNEFNIGDTITLCGIANSPEGVAPNLMVGIARADDTPVYGAFSNPVEYQPRRIDERRFAFNFEVINAQLLPGKYRFRAHTLDSSSLRLFDTLEREFTIRGETREHGLVRLAHRWN
jgi:lipopolysaccharide transport system ATP-binding protein